MRKWLCDRSAFARRAGESLFALDPSSSEPTPSFIRLASTTAVVSGVPQFVVATVEYGPEVINLNSNGKWVTAYVELPDDLDPANIELDSLAITAIDGTSIGPINAEAKWYEIGDFDNDQVSDLMVKFSRSDLQEYLPVGETVDIELQGMLTDGQPLKGVRSVGVIDPGNGKNR